MTLPDSPRPPKPHRTALEWLVAITGVLAAGAALISAASDLING